MAAVNSIDTDLVNASNVFWVNDLFSGTLKIKTTHSFHGGNGTSTYGGKTYIPTKLPQNGFSGSEVKAATFAKYSPDQQVSVAGRIASNFGLNVDRSAVSYSGINGINYNLNQLSSTSNPQSTADTLVDNTAGTQPLSTSTTLTVDYNQ